MEFLNTNKKAPAAVAPKEKVHSRRVGHAYPWHDTRDAARTTRVRKMDVLSDKLYSTHLHGAEFLHIGTPTPEPQLDSDALTPSSFACAGEQSGRMPHERAAEAAEAEAAEAADTDRRR